MLIGKHTPMHGLPGAGTLPIVIWSISPPVPPTLPDTILRPIVTVFACPRSLASSPVTELPTFKDLERQSCAYTALFLARRNARFPITILVLQWDTRVPYVQKNYVCMVPLFPNYCPPMTERGIPTHPKLPRDRRPPRPCPLTAILLSS